jgi:hypothetical protein
MTIINAYILNTFVDEIPKLGYQIELSLKSPVDVFNCTVIYTCTLDIDWHAEAGNCNLRKYNLIPTEPHKNISISDLIIDTKTKEIMFIDFSDHNSNKYVYGLVLNIKKKNGPFDYTWLNDYRCPVEITWKTIRSEENKSIADVIEICSYDRYFKK